MVDRQGGTSNLDRLIDVAVFAPLGLALTVGEALPTLTEKGRARLAPQLGAARTVGEMAVNEGRRRLSAMTDRRPAAPPGMDLFKQALRLLGDLPLNGFPLGPFGPSRASASGAARTTSEPVHNGTRVPGADRTSAPGPAKAAPRPSDRAAKAADGATRPVVRKAPDVETAGGHTGSSAGLAIPSYDALSATQVVQRLAGLSRDEVRAVRVYEASTRGRRTILAKADQLLA